MAFYEREFLAYNGTTLVKTNDSTTTITSLEVQIAKLVMPNNSKLMWYDSANARKSMLTLDGYNNLVLGEEQTSSGRNTYVRGYTLHLQSGNTYQNALSIAATGLVEIVKNTVGLKIGDGYLVWDSANNALKLTGANGAAVNFYATGGVSALGMSQSGQTAVAALTDLVDVNPNMSPNNGDALVYSSSLGKWTNGAATSGTVTSVGLTMPTGFSVGGSPITSSGTLAVSFASGYSLPTTQSQTAWTQAYNNMHTHSNKSVLDGITSAKVTNWDSAYTYITGLNVSCTAWGQTYWDNGPATISGALTSVTNITMNGVVYNRRTTGRAFSLGTADQFYLGQDNGENFYLWGETAKPFRIGTNNTERMRILSDGKVGINTTSPTFKLEVTGDIYTTVGLLSGGYVTALSDRRKKDIVDTVESLSLELLAGAPIIRYRWNDRDDKTVQMGSIAQYWQKIVPELTPATKDGYLSMDYGRIALVSVVSVARRILDHEERISRLESITKQQPQ